MDQEADTDIWGAFLKEQGLKLPSRASLLTELKGHIPQTVSEGSLTFHHRGGRRDLCSRSKLLKEINLTVSCSFCHSEVMASVPLPFPAVGNPFMYPHPHRKCFTLFP